MSDVRSFWSKWYAHVHIDDKYMLIIFKLTLIVACGVSSDKISSSSTRSAIASRTVKSIVEDNKSDAGADLRKVKLQFVVNLQQNVINMELAAAR